MNVQYFSIQHLSFNETYITKSARLYVCRQQLSNFGKKVFSSRAAGESDYVSVKLPQGSPQYQASMYGNTYWTSTVWQLTVAEVEREKWEV